MPHKAVAEELAITRAGRCRDTVEPWGNQMTAAACVPLNSYGYPVRLLAAVRGNQSGPVLAYAGFRGKLLVREEGCVQGPGDVIGTTDVVTTADPSLIVSLLSGCPLCGLP